MKNRKTFVGIALLLVVLVLGIAYAAITDSLKITGSATTAIDDANFKVVFTGETTPATTTDGVTAAATADTKEATLTVTGLTAKGQSKTATYKIKNGSLDLKADVNVDVAEITSNADYFKVTANIDKTTSLAPAEEATVTVVVELLKTPVEAITGNINIELNAEAVVM